MQERDWGEGVGYSRGLLVGGALQANPNSYPFHTKFRLNLDRRKTNCGLKDVIFSAFLLKGFAKLLTRWGGVGWTGRTGSSPTCP